MIPGPDQPPLIHFSRPFGGACGPMYLLSVVQGADGERYVFYDHLEIGRYNGPAVERPGVLQIDDPTVSSRHCVITRTGDGSCHIRDLSRNGTRVDGRRLVHNQETELLVGQVVRVGKSVVLRLAAPVEEAPTESSPAVLAPTLASQEQSLVTVLVGDIQDYTPLTRSQTASSVVHSVSNLFAALEREVERFGGTVKEYQGDAMLAFWEAGTEAADAVGQACRAAMALHQLERTLADDPSVWSLDTFPLSMDWALATGLVAMEGSSSGHAGGLLMVGEPMVRAFRMEKLAGPQTGSILACEATHDLAGPEVKFGDLGLHLLDGFKKPERIYALRSIAGAPA